MSLRFSLQCIDYAATTSRLSAPHQRLRRHHRTRGHTARRADDAALDGRADRRIGRDVIVDQGRRAGAARVRHHGRDNATPRR